MILWGPLFTSRFHSSPLLWSPVLKFPMKARKEFLDATSFFFSFPCSLRQHFAHSCYCRTTLGKVVVMFRFYLLSWDGLCLIRPWDCCWWWRRQTGVFRIITSCVRLKYLCWGIEFSFSLLLYICLSTWNVKPFLVSRGLLALRAVSLNLRTVFYLLIWIALGHQPA